jgi:hypothetical protein
MHDDRAKSLERAGKGRAAREHRSIAADQRSRAAEDLRSYEHSETSSS